MIIKTLICFYQEHQKYLNKRKLTDKNQPKPISDIDINDFMKGKNALKISHVNNLSL